MFFYAEITKRTGLHKINLGFWDLIST